MWASPGADVARSSAGVTTAVVGLRQIGQVVVQMWLRSWCKMWRGCGARHGHETWLMRTYHTPPCMALGSAALARDLGQWKENWVTFGLMPCPHQHPWHRDWARPIHICDGRAHHRRVVHELPNSERVRCDAFDRTGVTAVDVTAEGGVAARGDQMLVGCCVRHMSRAR